MTAPAVVIVGSGNIIGGREIMTLSLAHGLRAAGYRVVFFTSAWIGQGAFIARLRADGFEFYRMRLGFIAMTFRLKPLWWTLDQLRYLPALIISYRRRIREVRPKLVIHTNWHHALLLLPLLDRQRDIYWSHELISTSRHYGAVFRAISRRVRKIVCVSNAVAKVLAGHRIAQSRIAVIYNAIPDMPEPGSPPAHIPLRLGLVGQVGPWKGHDEVLEALALLGCDAGDVRLKIFGTGDPVYIAAIKNRAAALGIAGSIEWCGFVADLAVIFDGIDVCLMPSRVAESFGLSALEAGLHGRPVICTPMGALPEIVEDGVTGIVLKRSEDPALLADAIGGFLCDPGKAVRMGEAARLRMAQKFSYARFIQHWVDLAERRAV